MMDFKTGFTEETLFGSRQIASQRRAQAFIEWRDRTLEMIECETCPTCSTRVLSYPAPGNRDAEECRPVHVEAVRAAYRKLLDALSPLSEAEIADAIKRAEKPRNRPPHAPSLSAEWPEAVRAAYMASMERRYASRLSWPRRLWRFASQVFGRSSTPQG